MSDNLEKMADEVSKNILVYSVYDRTAGRAVVTFQAENDGIAIRDNAPSLAKVCPLGDLELYQIASLDVESRFLYPLDSWRRVSWDSYKFPENPFAKQNK